MLTHGARSVYFAAERDPDNMGPLYCKASRNAGRRGRNNEMAAVANQMNPHQLGDIDQGG